jgi:hypothetical protein
MRRLLVSALLATAVALSSCLAASIDGKSNRGHGPPAHAPAHGYRQHHQDAELAFDSKLGVYVVVGYSDHFYSDGRFLRFHADSWEVSARLHGPWTAYPSASVPPGLRGTHPSKAKRNKHKGHPPAKGRW